MLENTCGFLLKQINDALEKKGNQDMEQFGITMTQHSALFILESAEGHVLDFKQLEHRLGVAQSTAVGIIRRLEQKGLVTVLPSQRDHRTKQVCLTDAGLACVRHCATHIVQVEQALLAPLTPQEQTEFLSMLQKIRNAL